MRINTYRLKLTIRKYLDFSSREMGGFLIITVLILISIIGLELYNHFGPETQSISESDSTSLDSMVALIERNKIKKKNSWKDTVKLSRTQGNNNYFSFDPNTVSESNLIKLGLKPFLASRLIKFRSKGGKFNNKTDLLKIYGFPEELFNKLEPFIILKEKENITSKIETSSYAKRPSSTQNVKLDLNLADSAQLIKVYGIGPKLASRILKYKNKLGGFVKTEQLAEVYGLDSTVLNELFRKFSVKPNYVPMKLNVNNADLEILKTHPYLGFKFSKVVIAFRNQHGKIRDIEHFKEIKVFSIQDIEKINPYIEF